MVSKPKGWQWITLENVLHTLETGKRPKGGVLHQDSGVLSISAEHMTPSGGIDTSVKRFVPVDFYRAMKKGKVQLGDVLVVKDGATTGKTAYVDNSLRGEPIVVNEHVFICRPNRNVVNPRFLFYWLWSEEGWAQIRTCYQGSTIGGINRSFIQKVTVPLPPLCEQQRIAGILNQQMAYVEKARKAAEEILEAAQALPGAFLRQAFPAHGDALPAGWRWAKLGDVCKVNPRRPTGLQWKPHTKTTFVPMPSVDGQTGAITQPQERNYAEVSRGYTYFEEGDVLFAKITPCMQNGKHAIASGLGNGFGFGSTEFHVLRPSGAVLSEWVHKFLRQPSVLAEAVHHFRGSVGQQRVPKEFLTYLPIPLPPLPEQKRIAALLNEQMAYVETVRMSAREQLDAINALPAALLRRAFAGGL